MTRATAKKKPSLPDGFELITRNREKLKIKTLANGAEVHADDSCFSAFDQHGNYLGFAGSLDIAEQAAAGGHPLSAGIDDVAQLDLWEFWNSAVDGGARVMRGDDGREFVCIGGESYLALTKDSDGIDIEVLHEQDLWRTYADDDKEILDGLTVIKSDEATRAR